ncbi:MAG TPA: hypothetical protein VHY91_01145, partial [Pirellulales bacterium]|nr:hypothetical protein [Pirellulales bacterium]
MGLSPSPRHFSDRLNANLFRIRFFVVGGDPTAIASNFVAVFRAAGKLQGALHEFLRGALTHGGFFHVSTLGCGFFT